MPNNLKYVGVDFILIDKEHKTLNLRKLFIIRQIIGKLNVFKRRPPLIDLNSLHLISKSYHNLAIMPLIEMAHNFFRL